MSAAGLCDFNVNIVPEENTDELYYYFITFVICFCPLDVSKFFTLDFKVVLVLK